MSIRSRQEAEALYEVFTGPAWEYLVKYIDTQRAQVLKELVAGGQNKHDFHVGRLHSLDHFLTLKDDFLMSWKKLVNEGEL